MPDQHTYATLLKWLKDTRFDLSPRQAQTYHLDEWTRLRPAYHVIRAPIRTNDNTTASLQCSSTHYCSGNNHTPRSFEIWQCPPHKCLGMRDPEIDDPYAYIQVESIVEYLEHHDGIMDLNVQLAMNALEHE